ncbi:MAG TPA: HNH endonuclease signature motif containing protein [Candidatus Kapabacteria bacterium]|nr:HNH endonuclease signature motif containing protein [Candidatus Kapabacteria bacterium]
MPLEFPDDLRQLVIERADNRCEYCLLPQVAAFHKHEPDHIISFQHGGETIESNLALACMRCNRYKGPNIGSIDPLTGKLVLFFNPRIQHWADHFEFEGAMIRPRTPEARVTVKILRLNDDDRLLERVRLLETGFYDFI